MEAEAPLLTKKIPSSTIESLQELASGLEDNRQLLAEAAGKVDDDGLVVATLNGINDERDEVGRCVADFLRDNRINPASDGTLLGKIRTIWASWRAGLNSGDPTIVLIETEKADKLLLGKFRSVLPDISHMPVAVELDGHYETVNRGNDRVVALRTQYELNAAV